MTTKPSFRNVKTLSNLNISNYRGADLHGTTERISKYYQLG